MNNRYKKELTWEEKAKINPMYAVMSVDEFEEADTNPTKEQLELFYSQGERFWNRWFHSFFYDTVGDPSLRIMEYGCGMGRILNHASTIFNNVYGVDISKTQLKFLKQYAINSDRMNTLLLDEYGKIPVEDNFFDRIYSYAVFQHIKNNNDLVKAISEISRVLKPEGLIKLQFRTIHNLTSYDKLLNYRSFTFNPFTIGFYIRKMGFLFFPVLKIYKHNNWGGPGSFKSVNGYRKMLDKFSFRIETYELDQKNNMVWITARKRK